MSDKKFEIWCDSGANAYSCRSVTMSLSDFGLEAEEFAEMSDDEKEELFRDVAFDRLDWGWKEIPDA